MARKHRLRGRFGGDSGGAAALFGVVISGAIFTVTFVTVVETSGQQIASSSIDTKEEDVQAVANRLAIQLFTNPGQGWYAKPCTGLTAKSADFAPEKVSLFAMGSESCSGAPGVGPRLNVSLDKIHNLQKAKLQSDAGNAAVDYEEARQSLHTAPYDFHLRTRVALPGTDAVLRRGYMNADLRPLYIGDYDEVKATAQLTRTCGRTDNGNGADVWIEITNNGVTATAFELHFSVPLSQQTVDVTKMTGLVLPQASIKIWVYLPKSSDWAWNNPTDPSVLINIKDGGGKALGDCSVSFAGKSMIGASTQVILAATEQSLRSQITKAGLSDIAYEAFDGTGAKAYDKAHVIRAVDLAGNLPLVETLKSQKLWNVKYPFLSLQYTITLKDALGNLLGQDTLDLPRDPRGAYTTLDRTSYVPRAAVKPEAAYIRALVANFDAFVFDPRYDSTDVPFRSGGDIVPDMKDALNDQLPRFLVDDKGTPTSTDDEGTLGLYNVLVVGSNVDHRAMTSASAKDSVKKWVEAGGLLLVLGSEKQVVEWLQPIFHASIDDGSGVLSIPKADHRLLTVPNELTPATYSDLNRVWKIDQKDAANFETVVDRSGGVISASKADAYGKGRVVLTSYRAYNMLGQGATGPCDPAQLAADCAGLQLIQNFLTFEYDSLNLDYGPPLPTDSPIGGVTHLVMVYLPALRNHVEVRATVYVF